MRGMRVSPLTPTLPGMMTTPLEASPWETVETSQGLGTLIDERPQVSFGDGDHERFAHYVDKDKILASAMSGEPVTALCGKVWVPSRDPQRFPVCPTCREIYERLPAGDDQS